MRKNFPYNILFLPAIALYSGCVGEAPPELEGLVPVSVVVTENGSSLGGVGVSLSFQGPRGPWGCSGTTDEKGIARIMTNIRTLSGNGARPGLYTVVLDKPVAFPPDLEPDEDDANLPRSEQAEKKRKRDAFVEKNRIIPAALQSSSSSPIELTVEAKKPLRFAVDIAEYR